MKNLKQLRADKVRLEAAARSKLAEITAETNAVDAKRIEDEHAALLTQIGTIVEEIRAMKKDDPDDCQEDRAVDDEDEEDDDEDAAAKKKRTARALALRTQTAELAVIDVQARKLDIDLDLPGAIARGEKPDEMRKRLFDELAKKSADKGPTGSTGHDVQITRDERETRAGAMEVALVTRMLGSRHGSAIDYKPKDKAALDFVEQHRKASEQFMGLGFVELAANCIDYRQRPGQLLTASRADDILTRAFQTTSDFPAIFQNALNKALLSRYELAMPTYRRLAVQRNFVDFRAHPQVRAGEFPTLQPVTETGELKHGSSSDNYENVSVLPYGVIFSISRQMLVNDDISGIDQILSSAGDSVLIFENTTFFTMMMSASGVGPTLTQDSLAVFHATHANLAGTGVDPSVTSIAAGRAAMRAQKSISGNFLNAPPSIILTGPAQETAADQMVASITPTLTTSYNPFSGKLVSVSDANITGNDWYLFVEPSRVANFVYGFLNGATGPRTRTFEPFGVQGVKISLEHDFGVGAIDFRGAYRWPTH